MTFRERFHSIYFNGSYYAPSTIGAPRFLHIVDSVSFAKSKAEKEIVKEVKQSHKDDLRKAYGLNLRRQLNIPSKSISPSIKISF